MSTRPKMRPLFVDQSCGPPEFRNDDGDLAGEVAGFLVIRNLDQQLRSRKWRNPREPFRRRRRPVDRGRSIRHDAATAPFEVPNCRLANVPSRSLGAQMPRWRERPRPLPLVICLSASKRTDFQCVTRIDLVSLKFLLGVRQLCSLKLDHEPGGLNQYATTGVGSYERTRNTLCRLLCVRRPLSVPPVRFVQRENRRKIKRMTGWGTRIRT
jgi:hypothetical protein